MERPTSATYARQAQWLADLHEDLDVLRYPTRVKMLRAVEEAAHRAESRARLDHALAHFARPPVRSDSIRA